MTLRQAVHAATNRFLADPYLAPNAARDAELLLLFALDLPRTTIYAHPSRLLNPREQQLVAALVDRRLAHEPIQYITGRQEFFGLPLRVTPATLIPRPETELLVEAVLDRLPHDRPITLADIGTGSGAIALALASRLPEARVVASDLSEAALHVARGNAEALGLAGRVFFVHADLLTDLPSAGTAATSVPSTPRRRVSDQGRSHPRFHAILSNPPYVAETDRDTLHPQVRNHEPSSALFAGADGLEIYRRLIPQAALALVPGGLLALEFGAGQRDALAGLLGAWRDLYFLDDLQGIPRVALARRP